MINSIDLSSIKKYISSGLFYCKKHKVHDIYIFNYVDDFKNDIVWDDVNINLRGLVLDENGIVLNRPVKKFFTVREILSNNELLLSNGETLNYQNKKYKVFDKIEGHLCYLFWYGNEPVITSYKAFDSEISEIAHDILHDEYKEILTTLDRTKTYVFELIIPEYRLLVDYGSIKDLILISLVNNETGEVELPPKIGFKIPDQLTNNKIPELNTISGYNREGVIIYFDTGEMVKLKTQWYYTVSKLLQSVTKCQEKEFFFKEKIKKLIQDTSIDNELNIENQRSSDYNKELELSGFIKEVLQK